MAGVRKLTVQIVGEATGLSSALKGTDKQMGGLAGKFAGLSSTAKIALAGAATAVVAFGTQSVHAYVDAEKAQKQLSDAFKKFPQLAGANINKLRDLNTELAKKTKFDDDATATGQAVLAQFGLTGDELARITPLLQDYAARTGKDLPTAAKDLGKAINGQGRALKAVGINFEDTGTKAGNLEQLMGGLNDKVGGFAKNEGKTAAGKAAILKNQFGELQEKVGSVLVPALSKLADILLDTVFPAIDKIGSWLAEHKPVLVAVAGVIGVGLVAAFVAWATAAASAAAATLAATWPILAIGAAIAALVAGVIYAYNHWGWFHDAVDKVASFMTNTLWPALQSVAGWITGTLVPTVASIIGKFIEWGRKVGEVAGKIIGYIQGVISWARTNWPLILGILTGPIGLAVLAITKNWDTIKAGATAVKDWVVQQFSALVGWLWSLPGKVADIAGRIWQGLRNGLGAAITWILNQIDRLLGPLDEIAGKVGNILGKVGGFAGSVIGGIPGFATGVTNFGGGLAVVGERGPELLNLPRGSDVIPIAGRGSSPSSAAETHVHFHNHGVIGSQQELDRWVRRSLNRTENKGIR